MIALTRQNIWTKLLSASVLTILSIFLFLRLISYPVGVKDYSYQYFNKDWFTNNQKTLVNLTNNPLTKDYFRWALRTDCPKDKKIIKISPNSYTWLNKDGSFTTDFRTHNKFSKRLYFAFKPLWWLCHFWDTQIANRWCPLFNMGFDTLTVFPDEDVEVTSCDGFTRRVPSPHETWATIRAGAGTSFNDAGTTMLVDAYPSSTPNKWRILSRANAGFDTSELTASANVNSAILTLYGTGAVSGISGVPPTINIYVATPTSSTALVAADFIQYGTTAFSTAQTLSAWTAGGLKNFLLNSDGLANISKTGISKFGIRNANFDVAGTAPGWSTSGYSFPMRSADQSGLAQDPKLTVEYTLAGAAGVQVI